jgi:hypothetical protein
MEERKASSPPKHSPERVKNKKNKGHEREIKKGDKDRNIVTDEHRIPPFPLFFL